MELRWHRVCALALASGLMACGGPPTVEQLEQSIRDERTADPFLVVRRECRSHSLAQSCREVFDDLCARSNDIVREEMTVDFARRNWEQIGRYSPSHTECKLPPGLVDAQRLAAALNLCEDTAEEGCEVRLIEAALAKPSLDSMVQDYVDGNRSLVCSHHLSVIIAGAAPLDSTVTSFATALRYCGEAQLGHARRIVLERLNRGGLPGTTWRSLMACRTLRHSAEGDPDLRDACRTLEVVLGSRVADQVHDAFEADDNGYGLRLLDYAREQGLPVPVDATTAAQRRARVEQAGIRRAQIRVANGSASRDLLNELAESVRAMVHQLPSGMVWATDEEPEMVIEVSTEQRFQVHQSIQSTPAVHRYQSGTRTIENPDWLELNPLCELAKVQYDRCLRDQDQAQKAQRDCQSLIAREQEEYNACVQDYWRRVGAGQTPALCTPPPLRACPIPSPCVAEAILASCVALEGTPRHITEPVMSEVSYVRRTVTRSVRVPFRVRVLTRGDVGEQATMFEKSATDRAHDPRPDIGLEGDPLQLPTEATYRNWLLEQMATFVFRQLEVAKSKSCAVAHGHRDQMFAAEQRRTFIELAVSSRAGGCQGADAVERQVEAILLQAIEQL